MNDDATGRARRGGAADEVDPVLRAQLRAAAPEPPLDAVDWGALHGRITARAAARLAHAGTGRAEAAAAADLGARAGRPGEGTGSSGPPLPWWHLLGEQAFRAVPLSASLLAVVALLGVVVSGARTPAPPATGVYVFVTVEEELYDGLPGAVRPLLLAGAEAGVLLDAALFENGEEW